jgi:putative ABC transport system ATP-binding protein
MSKEILSMTDIIKSYKTNNEELIILNHINFKVYENEFISILGPSGAGKSTMMNIIGCLDSPTSGEYILDGTNIKNLTQDEFAKIRNKKIGFIFQSFNLLSRLSALENVELPLIYAGIHQKERRKRATELLERIGLKDRMNNQPNQLSGGQQQRVAIARALITNPSILLADEPTGALDQETGHEIMQLFHNLHNEGKTIIMITHDTEIAQNATRIVHLLDGCLYNEPASVH